MNAIKGRNLLKKEELKEEEILIDIQSTKDNIENNLLGNHLANLQLKT